MMRSMFALWPAVAVVVVVVVLCELPDPGGEPVLSFACVLFPRCSKGMLDYLFTF